MAKTKPKIERKLFERFLRCTLTEKELLDAGKNQADKSIEVARLEADKKRVMDDFKTKISALEAKLGELSNVISTGYEYRNVKCQAVLNEPRGKKTISRLDTGEIIGVEDMTQDELQLTLPVEDEKEQ